MTNLSGKVALVTGGSRGIGKATALSLARLGCSVAVTYRASDSAAAAVAEEAAALGVSSSHHKCDFAEVQQVRDLVKDVLATYGRIDILVNNAGKSEILPVADIEQSDWDHMFDVNLRGLFFCTQAVIDHMTANDGGSIVNVASTAGAVGGYFIGAHYATTKAGIISLTKSLAKAGAGDGIRINCVAPGLIATDMIDDYPQEKIDTLVSNIPLGRLGTADEVADSITFLASDASSYITGTTIFVNGGVYM